MKKKLLLALMLSGAIALTVGVGCGDKTDDSGKTPPSGIVTPEDPEKPGETEKKHTPPVITVNPKTVEIYAGDEIDLLFGVSAVDDEGNSVQVIISDSGDFDETSPQEGEYTITYSATAFELTSTETRTVKVLKELAPLTLETRTAFEKPGKWEKGTTINFRHREYHKVTEDSEFERMSGVFHNTSEEDVFVTVGGGGGCVAILDKNGVVIEGRDGANGRLVNAENPSRATSQANSFVYNGETITVSSSNTAKGMKIPAGGFAVVVQSAYLGADFDSDGRAFMDNVVINEYGNVVRLQWSDAAAGEYLTEYVNQAPKVSGNTDIFVLPGDKSFDLNAEIVKGIKVTDDDGTFETADDITLENTEIEVVNNGNFNIDEEGDYVITLSVSDGKLTTTFTRTVKVVGEEYITKVSIGTGTQYTFLKTKIAINQELKAIGSYAFIVYNYEYKTTHPALGFTNGWGEAYIIDRYGKIARTYDGANARYNDKDNQDKTGVVASATYAAQAYESLQEGETIVIAPNDGGANNANNGSRWILMQPGNRTAIGQDFHFTDLQFEEKPFVLTAGEGGSAKTVSALESKYAFNTAVADTSKVDMAVYTKAYTSGNPCTGWTGGWAMVVDKFGELTKIYDGVNNKLYDASNKADGTAIPADTSYAEAAFNALADGDMLIVLLSANNIAAAPDFKAFIGADVTFTDVTFAERTVEFAVGQNKLTVPLTGYSFNGEQAADAKLEIYRGYTEAAPTFTGYDKGVAVIVNKFGEIVKVYDGVNNKLYDAGHSDGTALDVSSKTYAKSAYDALTEGDMLVLFKGAEGEHITYALALKDSIDQTVTFTDMTFEARGLTVKIGSKSFFVDPKYYGGENQQVPNPAQYQMIVYTKAYGSTNPCTGWGYGAAIVLDSEGKLIKVYDGANSQYWENGAKQSSLPAGFSASAYAQVAYENLQDGEKLIVFPNCSAVSGNTARGWALGLRNANDFGQVLTITDTRKAD